MTEIEYAKGNYRKGQECALQDFHNITGTTEWECVNCGFVTGVEFVAGYERGLEHGFNRANTGVFPQKDITHDER